MKTRVAALTCILVASGALCLAQAPQAPVNPTQASQTPVVNDFKPASSNQPGKEYPQVNSEGRVRARLVAPDAQSVLLDIGAVRYPLTKGADGVWIGDSAPQDEGFHYYQLWVDSAKVPDPDSLYFYGASRWASGVATTVQRCSACGSPTRPCPMRRSPGCTTRCSGSIERRCQKA